MNSDPQLKPLADALVQMTPPPGHPALQHLVQCLQDRHRDCALAILFYGSCLRSGDPYDGLVDLYLIVDNYRCANQGVSRALLNWLLPPNVFYAEFPHQHKTIRCKYAVLTLRDFRKGTSPRWFHSYLWGRFSQPTAIAWSRDEQVQKDVTLCLAQAVITFINRALPSVSTQGSAESLWQEALKLSYATELRPESSARARQLTEHNSQYYRSVTQMAEPLLDRRLSFSSENTYRYRSNRLQRSLNRWGWHLRSLQGKLLSLTRLSKALFTFEGGLDYAAWKLERHSGQKVEIPDRVRRYPLIFVWGMVWRLYRRGVFR